MTVTEEAIVPVESISQAILVLRRQKVILDADLARLYGVTTARLNQQVRRNLDRFPNDFMFQLTKKEFEGLMLHFASSKKSEDGAVGSGRGGRRKLPLAFTEHGALMAAIVLNTSRAVDMRLYVVRAFVQMRKTISNHPELAHKLKELERRVDKHDKHIRLILEAIQELMAPSALPERRIGFDVEEA